MLAYHYPTVSAPGIPVDLLCELPVAGVKDSTGDPARLAVEIDEVGDGVYTGSAAAAAAGAGHGLQRAPSSPWPTSTPTGCRLAWDGDGACQRELVNGHRAGALAGIAGLKRALAGLHGTSLVTRLP